MYRKVFVFLITTVSVCVLSPDQAHAYIDPGTGATFVGSMGPLIVGILGGAFGILVKVFWHPLKRLFSKRENSSEEQSSSE